MGDQRFATSTLIVRPARSLSDFQEIGNLWREYALWLKIDANFPDLEEQITSLPSEFSPPMGVLLLAIDEKAQTAGCVGVRPLTFPLACEMKRLYVRKEKRSDGAGRILAQAAISYALSRYREMYLDTLPSMTAAISLYRSLGFQTTAPYYASPGPGALYFLKILSH